MTDLSWLALGLVLLVAEIIIPGVFLMWLGLAALGTGAAAWLGMTNWGWQVAVFAVLSLGSIAIGLRLRRPPERRVNMPESGLIGRVAHARAFEGREGRVRLGDSEWSAQMVHGAATPAPDARLRVVGVRGTVLVVQPLDEAGPAAPPPGT